MRLALLTFLLALPLLSTGQLKVNAIANAQDLMDTLLGDNENLIISNVSINGGIRSFGVFQHDMKYHDFFTNGIILSNGNARNAIGPNNNTQKSSKVNFNSDPDINRIAEHKGCYDTVLFEFDVISKTDKIQFQYFFGSEEYPEYINKNVNDIFVFLVTNLSTGATENIAILNGDKGTPITIDHINSKRNSAYYIENIHWNSSILKKYNYNQKQLELPFYFQYDGFTTVLQATAKVIPYVKYHFKLGISDVGDQLYDSAVFIEANSLRSSGKINNLREQLSGVEDITSIDFNIEFEVASSKLKGKGSILLLDNVIEQLLLHPNWHIKIVGHTDNRGSAGYNYELSLERAKAVKKYLSTQGIDAYRIETEGKGATQPKSAKLSENRRVEIVFIKHHDD